jgi:hypothetical protein
MSKLDIGTQTIIQKKWIEVASNKNPLNVGRAVACSKDNSNVAVVFKGIPFKFIYQLDIKKKTIRLLNCEKFSFLDYTQD